MTYFIVPGMRFNYLTVKNYKGKNDRGKKVWNCVCLCGNAKELETYTLVQGKAKTCGRCEWHINHKAAYITWMGMKRRCNHPEAKDFERYGAKGITYDTRWESFIEFFLDMGDPPTCKWTGERYTLDRKDNSLGYSKDNCRWTDRLGQAKNKTRELSWRFKNA